MSDNLEVNTKQILENTKTILLVDWPNPEVPRSLIKAGFTVFGYSPDRYSAIELGDDEKLIFRQLDNQPDSVDIVNVFRPEEEHAGIINGRVLPLKAKVLWLHPPVKSASTAALAAEHGLVFIEGIDIAEVARRLSGS
jgi:predicted CoA-binding protein